MSVDIVGTFESSQKVKIWVKGTAKWIGTSCIFAYSVIVNKLII